MRRREMLSSNLASEFYVASQLWRLGYVVTITLGHTKEIDLIVTDDAGRIVTIDVKGIKNRTNWPMKPRRIAKDHFFALVCWGGRFQDYQYSPEVFIVPSLEIGKLLGVWTNSRSRQTAVAYSKIQAGRYRNAWDLLFK